ncbi:hypothetical protein [Spirillospora sp. CA-294931]|uniref:hypothetical protein n=1 Tax=Spirillospora sp. CA-294931 TaxID=3240042 RepID=UPI003D8B2BFC
MSEGQRVLVSSPRTRRARAVAAPGPDAGWDLLHDLDQQTELGTVYARALIRAQLRTALVTCALVLLVVVGLPLLFALAPPVSRARVSGVPLSWVILIGGVQPVWIAAAFLHVRRAERTEREFVRMVGRR